MMKKTKKISEFFGNSLASFALMIGTLSANSACILYLHQPKVPAELKKLKK